MSSNDPGSASTASVPPAAPDSYPPGTVRALLATDRVTDVTRRALEARLARTTTSSPRCFDAAAYATLAAVCARLIVQPATRPPIDIAAEVDRQLADGPGDGWRHDALPPDADAHRRGLDGIERLSHHRHGAAFCTLDAHLQDTLLHAVQTGDVDTGSDPWAMLPAARWFEELLAAATVACYAHPLAQEDIGYVGMADAHGWQAIGLDRLDPHEPLRSTRGG